MELLSALVCIGSGRCYANCTQKCPFTVMLLYSFLLFHCLCKLCPLKTAVTCKLWDFWRFLRTRSSGFPLVSRLASGIPWQRFNSDACRRILKRSPSPGRGGEMTEPLLRLHTTLAIVWDTAQDGPEETHSQVHRGKVKENLFIILHLIWYLSFRIYKCRLFSNVIQLSNWKCKKKNNQSYNIPPRRYFYSNVPVMTVSCLHYYSGHERTQKQML